VYSEVPSDPATRLRQIQIYTTAYKQITPNQSYLPDPDSPLPALIAIRTTNRTIQDSLTCAESVEAELNQATARCEKERADLSDAQLIQSALEERILNLKGELEERTQQSPSQVARDMLGAVRQRKSRYDKETKRLVRGFNAFVDDHLAAMLAAEELGGPVVGEVLNITQDQLAEGFSSSGKVKRRKDEAPEGKRQRRIDEIWGRTSSAGRTVSDDWDEKRAAAAEMRTLTEQLLNNLADAEGGGSGAYVDLERESAAARFLVRSKVAQFHPRDARRLRLVDFGRAIDD
jgi:hypothetical protein